VQQKINKNVKHKVDINNMEIEETLVHLNEQQKEAVLTTEGYVRVIAGAGINGKIRVFGGRIGSAAF